MHTLNEEQRQLKQIIQAMQGGDRLVVSGRAGSGKTFAIANSVTDRKALFLAPTHPACTVLAQELQDKRHKVATIHSAIGWHRYRNDDLVWVDGYRPAKEQNSELFSDSDIIIVDEFSMVGSVLFGAVEEYAKEFALPVVYSGDRFQLPPVKDREIIMDQGFDTVTLKGSMRFPEDSEIFRLGETLRDCIEAGPKANVPCLFGGTNVQVVSGPEWIAELTRSYEKGESLLAVTSDNATLQRLRRKVRQVDHDWLDEGDLVSSKQTDDLFRNGDQFTIARIERDMRVLEDVPGCVSRFHTLSVDGFAITFEETDRVAFVVNDNPTTDKLSSRIRSLYGKGKLNREQAVRVLDWIEQINSFELSALATVHKSQGRSVDTIYIDTNTVLKRPIWLSSDDHKRLLYTAITRARKHVVFYEMTGQCVLALPKSQMVQLQQPMKAMSNVSTGQVRDQSGGLVSLAS